MKNAFIPILESNSISINSDCFSFDEIKESTKIDLEKLNGISKDSRTFSYEKLTLAECFG